MIAKCHRCTKSVYPVEKLSCLDKTWHKGCFNCEVCHMTLSMKTYKGYNKLPYCNTHYPTTKHTTVAETPENMRLKKNTENQSQITYQKNFLADKGKVTQVAETPENQRLAKAQKNASLTEYKQVGKGDSATAPPVFEPQYDAQPPPEPAPVAVEQVATPPAPAPAPPAAAQVMYQALYDYAAADDDEVTFVEGDIIINGEIIDDGWMTGTVQSTGEHGMLPSNYVEEMK